MSQHPFKPPGLADELRPYSPGQQDGAPLAHAAVVEDLRAALRLNPGNPRLWAKLMHHLWVLDRPHEALDIWRQTEIHLPEPQRPYLVLGNVQRDLNAFEAAAEAYARETELGDGARQLAVAWNHSQILIGLERYSQAFALAERRFQLSHHQAWRPPPYWQGWPGAMQTGQPLCDTAPSLTLWSEQGIGDTLQYLRWLPPLIQLGWNVRLEVEPPLLLLLRQGLAWLGPKLTVAPKGIGPLPLANPCQGSLLSLPWLLGGAPLTEVFDCHRSGSDQATGYLRSPHWPPPAPTRQRQPRIGLVWAAGRKDDDAFIHREYERRSLPAAALIDLLKGLENSGAELICLQYGDIDRQRSAGWSGCFADTLADGVSLADNARWISALDLVITVDTATAHLVGAMARPGWVLLPWGSDPRWLRQRDDSPWYPTLTLLRQPGHQDWHGLVQLVLERFQLWLAAWSSP